jgi:hypothetical protein
MFHPFTATDAVQNAWLLINAFRWHQNAYRLADHFFRPVAKNPFGAAVPSDNNAVQVLADDPVIRRFNDGRGAKLLRRLLGNVRSILTAPTIFPEASRMGSG